MVYEFRCVNRKDLIGVCTEYVSLVSNRVDGLLRVRVHEKIAEITGIDYDELKEYLWNLDKYGYDTRLEEMPFNEEKKYIIRKIAERLANELLSIIEDRLRVFFRSNPDVVLDLEKYGYDIDSWIEEWKDNGYWLCDGEPILHPETRGDNV